MPDHRTDLLTIKSMLETIATTTDDLRGVMVAATLRHIDSMIEQLDISERMTEIERKVARLAPKLRVVGVSGEGGVEKEKPGQ